MIFLPIDNFAHSPAVTSVNLPVCDHSRSKDYHDPYAWFIWAIDGRITHGSGHYASHVTALTVFPPLTVDDKNLRKNKEKK